MGYHHHSGWSESRMDRERNEQLAQQEIIEQQQKESAAGDEFTAKLLAWFVPRATRVMREFLIPAVTWILTVAALRGPWWSKLYIIAVNAVALWKFLSLIRERGNGASKIQCVIVGTLTLAGGLIPALALYYRLAKSRAKYCLAVAILVGGFGGYHVLYSMVHALGPQPPHNAHALAHDQSKSVPAEQS
jgi:hypothetical protein